MARIAGVNIPLNKRAEIGLTYVFGVGRSTAAEILEAAKIDPNTYERLIWPREKKLVDAIRGMGAYVKLHICGNITHLLPGIAKLGIDILDVDHMVDMAGLRDKVGRKVAIAGNMDPVTHIQQGTPASICDEVKKAYETVGNPYIVNAGCEIPPGTPDENLKALCEPVSYVA